MHVCYSRIVMPLVVAQPLPHERGTGETLAYSDVAQRWTASLCANTTFSHCSINPCLLILVTRDPPPTTTNGVDAV